MLSKLIKNFLFIFIITKQALFSLSTLYWGFGLDGYPIQEKQLKELVQQTSLQPQLISIYLQWPRPKDTFLLPASSLEAIWDIGAVPCITWEPMHVVKNKRIAIPEAEILNGSYNPYLAAMAKTIIAFENPVILRFAHEMNLKEYHWGTTEEAYGPQSPQTYVKIFSYVFDYFKNMGVKNVLWAFCPNSDSLPNEPWNKIANYYPGDQIIDLLGIDGYNWDSPYREFKDIFFNAYTELKKISPGKPLFIFETASSRQPKRQEWLQNAIKTITEWGIQGVIWFQVNKEKDWRLGESLGDNLQPIKEKATTNAQEWAKQQISNRL